MADEKILWPIENQPGVFCFWCPGCDCAHQVHTEHPNAQNGAKWGFNGNMESPTFTPSLLARYPHRNADGQDVENICHTFITDGHIQYLSDCTHKLAGQTIPMKRF